MIQQFLNKLKRLHIMNLNLRKKIGLNFYPMLLLWLAIASTSFSSIGQNCPDYSNTINASGEACSQQPYVMSVANTNCNGQIYFQYSGSLSGGLLNPGNFQIVSVQSGQTVASGSGGLFGGTVNGTVGPLDPNMHGSVFDLIVDDGNITVSQNGNTLAQSNGGHQMFSVSITISSATMTIQTPSGPVTQTAQSCKDFFMNVSLDNTNFCTPINVNLPWSIKCDATGATLASGTHTVTVNPTVPTDATDVVDITWNDLTCSWDVSANNDCDLLDIGTIFDISPSPASLDYNCTSGNENFVIEYFGIPGAPNCCDGAGPLEYTTYDYTTNTPTQANSIYGGVNNAGYLNIPPNGFGGTATNLQLCVDVTNFCFNTSTGDNTWYVNIIIDGIEVYMGQIVTGNSHNICLTLADLPFTYNQASNVEVYVMPNLFSIGNPPSIFTTFIPNGNCGSFSDGQWTANISASISATYSEQSGSPVDCSNFQITAPYTACGLPTVNAGTDVTICEGESTTIAA